MKKSLLIVLALLLLLTACQTLPDDDRSLASMPSSSSSITPPSSSSMVPPTRPTAPTIPPTTQPTVPPTVPADDISDGYVSRYVDRLYWVVEGMKEHILICEKVVTYARNDTHVFFVSEPEPTKVYAAAIGDFSKHELVYESTYGNISFMNIESDLQGFLQFVAEEKKFVILDLTTGERTLLMEQDYIAYAWLYGTGDGSTWSEIIEFEGLPSGEKTGGTFTYNYVTGEFGRGDTDCDCEECV